MYYVGGKLLNGNKSIYVKSLACLIVKGGESECFRINSGVRQCIYGRRDERGEDGDGEERSEVLGGGKIA